MPRLSKADAVREMMVAYGQPQTVEAIQQYVEEHAGHSMSWPEISAMVAGDELAVVDGGRNPKGGKLLLYGPGPALKSDGDAAASAADRPQAAPENAPMPSGDGGGGGDAA